MEKVRFSPSPTPSEIRSLFPITQTKIRGTLPLIYLDHAASTHPPLPVLQTVLEFTSQGYANVHRGAHELSERSTEIFEQAREKVAEFLDLPPDREVVFVHNTTFALNLASHLAFHEARKEGREKVTISTLLEHHSNLLPHRERGRVLVAGMTPEGRIDLSEFEDLVRKNPHAALAAVTAASNVTGYTTDLASLLECTKKSGLPLLVDGAQILAHSRVRFRDLPGGGPEYFAAAGHKAYAPFGCAFLVAPSKVLESAPPLLPGGGTVSLVTEEGTWWGRAPTRHEGGTPPIVGAAALSSSLEFLRGVGWEWIESHERALLSRLLKGLSSIRGVRPLGSLDERERIGVVSFVLEGVPPARVARELNDRGGVAVRHGCFCAHPYVLRLLGIPQDDPRLVKLRSSPPDEEDPGAVRVSLGIYNTEEEIESFLQTLEEISLSSVKIPLRAP